MPDRGTRPAQRGAFLGFLAVCLVVLVDNALVVGRVANTPAPGTDELSPWWVVAPQGAAFLLYAWVWSTVVLVWSSRTDPASLLAERLPVDRRTYPYSGLGVGTRTALYLGAVVVGASVPLVGGGLRPADVPQVLLASLAGHLVAVLFGVIAAGVLSYPAVLVWRSLQLHPDDVSKHDAVKDDGEVEDRPTEQDVRRARQGLVGLAVVVLLVVPVAVCLALAYESPYGRRVDVLPLVGVVRDGVVVDSPLLLWVGRAILLVMALALVRVVTAGGAMRKVLVRRRDVRAGRRRYPSGA